MFQKVVGLIRGLDLFASPDDKEDERIQLGTLGDKRVSQGLPELAEIVRMQDSWQARSGNLTGTTSLPTAFATFGLKNNERDNGKVYVIDSVCVFRPIIDVTTDDSFCVQAQVRRLSTEVVTSSIVALRGLCGNTYAGHGVAGTSVSTEGGRWDVIGSSPPTATAIAGTAWTCLDIPLYGRYVVPPRSVFGISITEVTATSQAFQACIRWHEVYLPNRT